MFTITYLLEFVGSLAINGFVFVVQGPKYKCKFKYFMRSIL